MTPQSTQENNSLYARCIVRSRQSLNIETRGAAQGRTEREMDTSFEKLLYDDCDSIGLDKMGYGKLKDLRRRMRMALVGMEKAAVPRATRSSGDSPGQESQKAKGEAGNFTQYPRADECSTGTVKQPSPKDSQHEGSRGSQLPTERSSLSDLPGMLGVPERANGYHSGTIFVQWHAGCRGPRVADEEILA